MVVTSKVTTAMTRLIVIVCIGVRSGFIGIVEERFIGFCRKADEEFIKECREVVWVYIVSGQSIRQGWTHSGFSECGRVRSVG